MASSHPPIIGQITLNFRLSLPHRLLIPKEVKWVVFPTHLVLSATESRYFQHRHNNCKAEVIDPTVINLICSHPISPNAPHQTKINTLCSNNIYSYHNIHHHHNKISWGICSSGHNHNRKGNPVGLRLLRLLRVQRSSHFPVMQAECLRYRNLLDNLEARSNPRESPSLLDLLNLQLLVHLQYQLRYLLQIAALLLGSPEGCRDRREWIFV